MTRELNGRRIVLEKGRTRKRRKAKKFPMTRLAWTRGFRYLLQNTFYISYGNGILRFCVRTNFNLIPKNLVFSSIDFLFCEYRGKRKTKLIFFLMFFWELLWTGKNLKSVVDEMTVGQRSLIDVEKVYARLSHWSMIFRRHFISCRLILTSIIRFSTCNRGFNNDSVILANELFG